MGSPNANVAISTARWLPLSLHHRKHDATANLNEAPFSHPTAGEAEPEDKLERSLRRRDADMSRVSIDWYDKAHDHHAGEPERHGQSRHRQRRTPTRSVSVDSGHSIAAPPQPGTKCDEPTLTARTGRTTNETLPRRTPTPRPKKSQAARANDTERRFDDDESPAQHRHAPASH